MQTDSSRKDLGTEATNMPLDAVEIPLEKIKRSKFSLRPIDIGTVDNLANSIKNIGLLQPILVRPMGDDYEIVFGNHRYEACKKLALPNMRCYVQSLSDEDAFVKGESENLQRHEFLDPIMEGRGFNLLLKRGDSEAEIAHRIQRTQQYVSIRLNLLRLEPEIQDLITRGLVGADHGYEISKIPDDPKKRQVLAELCKKDGGKPLTVAELRQMVKETLEDLASKDPRVEELLMQDPFERSKRLEKKIGDVDQSVKDLTGDRETSLNDWVFGRHPEIRQLQRQMSALTATCICKRDNCTHYDGDICLLVTVKSPKIPYTYLREVPDRKAWAIRVHHHPEYCAACHRYVESGERNRKLKDSPITREDIDSVFIQNI